MNISATIIGLGNIGLGYDLDSVKDSRMTHTGACVSHKSVTEIYGVDPDSLKRSTFEKTTKSLSFANIAELKNEHEHIDLCIISTPTRMREKIVKECVTLSPKAILIEKPLSDNLEEAERIIEICKTQDISLYVNYIRLFDPVLNNLKKRIANKEFASPCGGECCFSGSVLNTASHYISLLIEWLGIPENVVSVSREESQEHFIFEYNDFNFSFKAVSGTSYPVGEMNFWFPEYKITLNDCCMNAEIYNCINDPIFPKYQKLDLFNSAPAELLNYQYHVLDYITSDMLKESSRSGSIIENAYQTLKLCMAVV